MQTISGQCECGQSRFHLSRLPTRRFICHCSICRAVYKSGYSDFMVTSSKTVNVMAGSPIVYSKYKRPPALDRRICQSCECPVMSYLTLLPGMTLAFVPTYSLGDADVPEPSMHIYYHSRTDDVKNNIPKISGGIKSQAACLAPFSLAFFGR